MRSSGTAGRPPSPFGYTGSMSAQSSLHGTTRSISARNCARRVVFAYLSNPEPASVICLFFIVVPRSCSLSAEAPLFRQVNRGLIQRFPNHESDQTGAEAGLDG